MVSLFIPQSRVKLQCIAQVNAKNIHWLKFQSSWASASLRSHLFTLQNFSWPCMSLSAVEAQGTARSHPTHSAHLEMVTSPTLALLHLHPCSRQTLAICLRGGGEKHTKKQWLENAQSGYEDGAGGRRMWLMLVTE